MAVESQPAPAEPDSVHHQPASLPSLQRRDLVRQWRRAAVQCAAGLGRQILWEEPVLQYRLHLGKGPDGYAEYQRHVYRTARSGSVQPPGGSRQQSAHTAETALYQCDLLAAIRPRPDI